MKFVVFISLLTLALLNFGCASNPATQSVLLYQSINTDNVAVVSATALYKSGSINIADAKAVYVSGVATESALRLWQVELNANSSSAPQTATLVAQDISTLLAQLQSMQTHLPASVKAKLTTYTLDAKTKATISSSDIISIVELAIQLTPEISDWAQSIFATTTVTADQITQAFTTLDASLASLQSAIAPSAAIR